MSDKWRVRVVSVRLVDPAPGLMAGVDENGQIVVVNLSTKALPFSAAIYGHVQPSGAKPSKPDGECSGN